MYELALFAGAGGGILGGHLNGWRCVGAVECEGYPRGVLAARQNDGCLPAFPIWTDVRSFSKRNNATRPFFRWLRRVRRELVISGGFPCQDISAAGKGAGIEGERSGLWREFARIIREIRPAHVLVENSPILTGRGLDRVLGDLAALGYDADWGVLGACDVGAPHKRERIWIVVHAPGIGCRAQWIGSETALEDSGHGGTAAGSGAALPDALQNGLQIGLPGQRGGSGPASEAEQALEGCDAFAGSWWHAEPDVGRVAHGVAHRVDRIKALGNGQVPAVVRAATEILSLKIQTE